MDTGSLPVSSYRWLAHSPSSDDIALCPGGRFAVVGPIHEPGSVLYYDLDDEVPIVRTLVTYDIPWTYACIFVSLFTTASTHEFWLAAVSTGTDGRKTEPACIPAYLYMFFVDYDAFHGDEETQIDLWRITLSADYTQLQPTRVSTIRADLRCSKALTLTGSILSRVSMRGESWAHGPAVVELVDLARSMDDQLFGAGLIPSFDLDFNAVSFPVT